MNHIIILRTLLSAFCILFSLQLAALDLDHYRSESVLASGRWVKISVSESGLHRITAASLRKWGFNDPSKVRIFGYGGKRIADALTAANYIDDLPQVQARHCSDGSVVFYAVGPESWEGSSFFVNKSNPYSTVGCYFVTDNECDEPAIEPTARAGATKPATSFTERLQYEQDLLSPGECGVMLVGEDFKYTPKRIFSFDLPDICGPLTFQTSFVAKTLGSASRLNFTANGNAVESLASDVIPATSGDGELHGVEARSLHIIDNPGNRLQLSIDYQATGVVYNAWLNYIAINYERSLRLPSSGSLCFRTHFVDVSLDGATPETVIWDVTDPAAIRAVDFSTENNTALWTARYPGMREYAAWNTDAVLPAPKLVGAIANQNLHADESVDMVIFTHSSWRLQAERIAELHRGAPDNYKVRVVDLEEVYNEFSSGVQDVSGMRKYLKMLYDRGKDGQERLKYVLLMGRMTYDERHLTSGVRALGCPTVPAWQQREERYSLDSEMGFATDDFLAMLEDGSGLRLGSDYLSVAVGRLPVTSATTAKRIADKLIDYMRNPPRGAWKNRVLALADDLDAGIHYRQCEWFMRGFDVNENNSYVREKVYLPIYEKTGGVYQIAREKLYRLLDSGVAWWSFVGHATNHSWTADGMLTYSDINKMYLKHLPFVYAATCNFLRWDSNTQSGGEILMYEPNGGVIGMISATRPVYITYNGYFTNAIGKEVNRRDESGRLPATGEIYRRAKNNIRSVDENDREGEIINNENRLRYVFMGDPAMKLATPDNLIRIESVDGVDAYADNQIIIPAKGMPVIKGSVITADGSPMSDFNGTLLFDLYDADRSYTITDPRYENLKPFDEHGDKLYSGSCKVTNGAFELTVSMPAEISDNFREATVFMTAYSDDYSAEASGLDHSLYVYGFNEEALEDNQAPTIESMALNHPSFVSGDEVNADPMLIATVRDDVGINLSSAGIGHQMTITLDDKRSFNDVPFYFTPSSDGTPSGSIAYPLEGLTIGNHTLTLRVFDTNGNSAAKTIDFFVSEGIAPTIFDIYSDVNPATTEANFYISHNRPDGMLTVTVSVFNLLGHKLWEQTSTGRSDMFVSSPVTWDLTDGTGRRVPRGIYLYRATVTADGETFVSGSRKIAVTSR